MNFTAFTNSILAVFLVLVILNVIFIVSTNHHSNVKFDKFLKFTKTSTYRTWRNTTEYVLTALEFWNIFMGLETTFNDDASENDKQDYTDKYRNCTVFLFFTVDFVFILIFTTNVTSDRIWKALKSKFDLKTTEIFLIQFRNFFRMKLNDRVNLFVHFISFQTQFTRFQHRCATKKESDDMNFSYFMKDFVTVDNFKIITLLSTLPPELDDQVNIITLRNFTYDQVTEKLSSITARDKLKKKKKRKR